MAKEIDVIEVLRMSGVDVFPAVYSSIDAADDFAALSTILASAPQLQSRFIRVVNEMHPAASSPDNAAEALARAGLEQSKDLLLALLAVDLFMPLGPDIVSRQDFWRHSVACAVAARALAQLRNEMNVERFFVAGLLHDVGSLLIYTNISERSLLTILHGRDVEKPLYELEKHVIGFDHAQLGAEVLQALKLPSWLQEAVGKHHAPETAQRFPLEAALVHVADIIVNAMKFGTRGEFKVPPLTPAAWDRIGLQKEALASLMEQVDELAQRLIPAFKNDRLVI